MYKLFDVCSCHRRIDSLLVDKQKGAVLELDIDGKRKRPRPVILLISSRISVFSRKQSSCSFSSQIGGYL